MQNVGVCDTTLRDGEQMPGVVFSPREKTKLAQSISKFGCRYIELMPSISKSETLLAKNLAKMNLDAEIVASTMMRKEHINLAIDCGIKHVTLFTPLSDIHLKYKIGITREENMSIAVEAVDYCRDHGLKVSFAGEDATRADMNYLRKFVKELENRIEYFLPCDTLGCLTPLQTFAFVRKLKEASPCKIALHVHNDFGLATSNTLMGIVAGADMFSGTFCGIGERSGNAPIEEVCIGLKYLYDMDIGVKYGMIKNICDLVSLFSRVSIQPHKPIIGENAFAHESGIHVDGVIKHPMTYENFDPEEVGFERKFLLGKHSGSSVVRHLLGNSVPKGECKKILEQIKIRSEYEGRSFLPEEIFGQLNGWRERHEHTLSCI